MEQAYAHCRTLVRAADKDRYLAALFLPADARPHAFALYAFNAEVAAVRERAREPLAGEVRLQWWRDVLSGNAAGDVARNPVAAALLDTLNRKDLPRAPLEALIEARRFDLDGGEMPTRAAFESYVRTTSSTLFDLVGRVLASEGAKVTVAAEPAGLAYGITGLLRAFPLHASQGQIYLPADALHEAGVDRADLVSGRATPALHTALADLRIEAWRHLADARARIAALPFAWRPAFLPLALVDGYLARMERPDYDPFRTPVEVPQWRRQWALWRAARRI
jgi:phytoene synthase